MARPLVERLVDAGLLTSDVRRIEGGDGKVVEIAHEALLRQWPLLNHLVEERRDDLAALEQVKRDAKAWGAAGRSDDALLHRGGRLSHVESLLTLAEMQAELGVDGRGYLVTCRQRENQAAERERRQIEKTRRAQRRAAILLTGVALVIAVAGFSLSRVARVVGQNRSAVLASLAANAYESGQYDRAVRFALSGMMRDWSGSDALPLLAFTLERLVHDYGGDGRILRAFRA